MSAQFGYDFDPSVLAVSEKVVAPTPMSEAQQRKLWVNSIIEDLNNESHKSAHDKIKDALFTPTPNQLFRIQKHILQHFNAKTAQIFADVHGFKMHPYRHDLITQLAVNDQWEEFSFVLKHKQYTLDEFHAQQQNDDDEETEIVESDPTTIQNLEAKEEHMWVMVVSSLSQSFKYPHVHRYRKAILEKKPQLKSGYHANNTAERLISSSEGPPSFIIDVLKDVDLNWEGTFLSYPFLRDVRRRINEKTFVLLNEILENVPVIGQSWNSAWEKNRNNNQQYQALLDELSHLMDQSTEKLLISHVFDHSTSKHLQKLNLKGRDLLEVLQPQYLESTFRKMSSQNAKLKNITKKISSLPDIKSDNFIDFLISDNCFIDQLLKSDTGSKAVEQALQKKHILIMFCLNADHSTFVKALRKTNLKHWTDEHGNNAGHYRARKRFEFNTVKQYLNAAPHFIEQRNNDGQTFLDLHQEMRNPTYTTPTDINCEQIEHLVMLHALKNDKTTGTKLRARTKHSSAKRKM